MSTARRAACAPAWWWRPTAPPRPCASCCTSRCSAGNTARPRSSPTCRPTNRTATAPSSASPTAARSPCCRCPTTAIRWCGRCAMPPRSACSRSTTATSCRPCSSAPATAPAASSRSAAAAPTRSCCCAPASTCGRGSPAACRSKGRTTTANERYDLVIVGAGMVGATLAAALAGSALRVALLEGCAPQDIGADAPVELRVSAITRASQQIFTRDDAWVGMTASRVSPFREMYVWDGGGAIHFDSADVGEDALGHIVENRVVQIALWQRLQNVDNVSLICPAACTSLRRERDRMHVELADGRVLSARVVVGADGAQSRVRQFAAIPTHGWAYDQHALVATVRHECSHRETAWQHFLSDGPLAFLPLHDGRCYIVWSPTPLQADRLAALDAAAFCDELGRAFDHKLGRMLSCSERAVFPLRLQHTERYVAPGLALGGDAAHIVHTLAGQGVNLLSLKN